MLAALTRIGEQAPGAEVLIVARRNAELMTGNGGNRRGTGIDRRTIDTAADRSAIRLTCSTVHKAKGTEADYVIMLDTGPPRAGEAAGAKALERALRVFRGADRAAEEERAHLVRGAHAGEMQGLRHRCGRHRKSQPVRG